MKLVLPAFWSFPPKWGSYYDPSPDPHVYPYCIYFYHVTQSPSGSVVVEAYYCDVGVAVRCDKQQDDLSPLIEKLVRNARGSKDDPHPAGYGLGAIPWHRISWLVAVLDGFDTSRNFPHHRAVKINYVEPLLGFSVLFPNHCFFGGEDKTMVIDGKAVSVMWTKNHMLNRFGSPLGEEEIEHFRFLFPSITGSWLRSLLAQIFDWPDQSGTNNGSSQPPP